MPDVLSNVMPTGTVAAVVAQGTYTISGLATLTEFVLGVFLALLVIQILFGAIGRKVGGTVAPAAADGPEEEEDDDEDISWP